MSPTEPPDPMDDVLDELLLGADEDLQNSLRRVLDLPRGHASISEAWEVEHVRLPIEPRPKAGRVAKARSVEDRINELEALLITLSSDRIWPVGLNELDELRHGLAARRLSRDDADQLIEEMTRQVVRAQEDHKMEGRRRAAAQVVNQLAELRAAVARLFDDSHDQNVLR